MQPIEVNSCRECPLRDKEYAECGSFYFGIKTQVNYIDNTEVVHPSCPINKGKPFVIKFEPKK